MDYLNTLASQMDRPETAYLVAAILKAKNRIKEIDSLNMDNLSASELKDQLRTNIKAEYFERVQGQREASQQMLNKIEQTYKAEIDKDSSKSLLNYNKMDLKYSAMSDEELRAEGLEILEKAGKYYEPNRLDIMSKEMKKRGSDIFEQFREHISKFELNKPWIHIETGQKMNDEYKYYNNIKYGEFGMLLPDQKGTPTQHNASIDRLFEVD
jgi:hypothetical protein